MSMTVLHNPSQHLQRQDEENVYTLGWGEAEGKRGRKKTSEAGDKSSLK